MKAFVKFVQSNNQLSSVDAASKPISFSVVVIAAEKDTTFDAGNSFPCALLGDMKIGGEYLVDIRERSTVYDSAKHDKVICEKQMTFSEVTTNEILVTRMLNLLNPFAEVTFKDYSKDRQKAQTAAATAKGATRRSSNTTGLNKAKLAELKALRGATSIDTEIVALTAKIDALLVEIKAVEPAFAG